MKIFLTSIGTRGDIEPFIAHGQILEKNGHQVYYAFPSQFSNLVPSHNQFFSLSPKILELIHGEKGRTIMSNANLLKKLKALWYLYQEGQKVNKDITQQHFEAVSKVEPDIIINNPKCSFPTLWSLNTGKPHIWLSPVPFVMRYVEGHAHLGFGSSHGRIMDKFTYKIANYGLTKNIKNATKHLSNEYKFSESIIKRAILKSKMIFAVSPALCPRPDDWQGHVQITGYRKIKNNSTVAISDEVTEFLNNHANVVLITFGSMLNDKPKSISRMIYNVLEKTNTVTIVNTASGGLIELDEYRNHPNFLFVDYVNYDFVFPKLQAVIHHGGSGTTHTALKYACPTMIIPHVIDQFQWNRLIKKIGVGPLGPSINKIDVETFKKSLLDLINNPLYKVKVVRIANQMDNDLNQKSFLECILEDKEE